MAIAEALVFHKHCLLFFIIWILNQQGEEEEEEEEEPTSGSVSPTEQGVPPPPKGRGKKVLSLLYPYPKCCCGVELILYSCNHCITFRNWLCQIDIVLKSTLVL